MAKAAKNIAKEEKNKVMTYRITAKIDGFRRAEIIHTGVREYAKDELSEAQLTAIETEPLLILERLQAEEIA